MEGLSHVSFTPVAHRAPDLDGFNRFGYFLTERHGPGVGGAAGDLQELAGEHLDVSAFLSCHLSCGVKDLVAVVAHVSLKLSVGDIANDAG